MVLDKMHNGKFVFKNTHEKNKQVEMAVHAKEAPEEFFFVNIMYKKTTALSPDPDNSSEDENTDKSTDDLSTVSESDSDSEKA